MKFDKKSDAIDWAKSQSQMTHVKHKVVHSLAWYHDREKNEYYQRMCYTVIIK